MPVVSAHSAAPPEAVFAVLADGRRYADWVVGAKRIRSVDVRWPSPGAEFRHAVGVGPFEIRDRTTVQALDPGRSITLRVRARPVGVACVHVELAPTEDGGTEISIDEVPVDGLARAMDNPLQRALLRRRNHAALGRLAKIAESEVRQTS